MKHLCVIPFSGFYYSVHDDSLDQALDQMFSDHETGCRVNEGLVMHAWRQMNWRQVHIDYAKEYCENFGEAFHLDLGFESMKSPREYNFTGDICYGLMGTADLLRVFDAVDTPALRTKVKENHSSRDGFISFYDNDLGEWGNVLSWDHNQIGTLLEAFTEQESTNDWDQYEEYSLMSDSFGNGFLDEILYRNCPAMERLCKIHEYLEARAKREEVAA